MSRYDFSGGPRDSPIAAMDTHGCVKLGRGSRGGQLIIVCIKCDQFYLHSM